MAEICRQKSSSDGFCHPTLSEETAIEKRAIKKRKFGEFQPYKSKTAKTKRKFQCPFEISALFSIMPK